MKRHAVEFDRRRRHFRPLFLKPASAGLRPVAGGNPGRMESIGALSGLAGCVLDPLENQQRGALCQFTYRMVLGIEPFDRPIQRAADEHPQRDNRDVRANFASRPGGGIRGWKVKYITL